MKPYYDDGQCAIYHGDCREILPTLWFGVDLVLTDPPYGIAFDTDLSRMQGGTVYPPIAGDGEPFDPTPLLVHRCCLWGANHYADRLPASGGWIVWDKVCSNGVRAVLSDAELAWTNLSGNVRVFRHMWNGGYRQSERGSKLHPAQKPVALMAWVIAAHTVVGNLVLDPYMGSGPVLRAAKDLGRSAIGIEIEERYCEIAAKRLAQEVLPLEATA